MAVLIIIGVLLAVAALPERVQKVIGKITSFLFCLGATLGVLWKLLPLVIGMLEWIHGLLGKLFGRWPGPGSGLE